MTSKVQTNAEKTIRHLENIVNSKASDTSGQKTSRGETTSAPQKLEMTTSTADDESTTGIRVKTHIFLYWNRFFLFPCKSEKTS
jgi:hypothetical protein